MGDAALGTGSFGETWLAFDATKFRQVVVKFFIKEDLEVGFKWNLRWPRGFPEPPESLVMADQECKSAQEIYQKNGTEKGKSRITQCLDNQIKDGLVAHLVLEVAGTHEAEKVMIEYIEKRTKPPPDFVIQVARQLLEALQQIEAAGFTHLDIKLENMMVYKSYADGRTYMRLIDFGLALPYGDTISGYRGSPAYMAPELLANGMGKIQADFKSDVFSAGVALHELICARDIYSTLDQAGVQLKEYADVYRKNWEQIICQEDKVDPELLELYRVVKSHMLQPDPTERKLASALLEDPVLRDVDIPPCRPREPFIRGADVTNTFQVVREDSTKVFRQDGRNAAGTAKCCCPQEGVCLAVPNSVLLKKCPMRAMWKSSLSCQNCMPVEGMINVEKMAAQRDPNELQCWNINPILEH